MAKITSPVKGFTGHVVGVIFTDGHAEADGEGALNYFRRHNYTITGEAAPTPTYPDGVPTTDWKGGELKAYAKAHEVNLSGTGSKETIVAAIVAAGLAPADPVTEDDAEA